MPSKSRDLVLVGEVAKPHGIQGEVCVRSHADSLELFSRAPTLLLGRPGAAPRAFVVQGWRPHKGGLLLRLAGVDDRNRAEELRGMQVWVRAENLPPLAEDEIYLHQLEGLAVLLPDGSRLGTLVTADASAGQEIWSVATDDGREALLPAAPQFVLHIDLDAGSVTVDPPPGLLDIYLSD